MATRDKDKYKQRYAQQFGRNGRDGRDHGNPYGRDTQNPDYALRGETRTYRRMFDPENMEGGGMPYREGIDTRYPAPYGRENAREDSYTGEPTRRPGLEYDDSPHDEAVDLSDDIPGSPSFERARDAGPLYGYSEIRIGRPTRSPAPGRHRGIGPKGYRRSDTRIEEDVNETLTLDPNIDASEIEIAVKDGVVTLSGTVESRQIKRMAEDAIEHVSGVRDVQNQLRIKSHE